MPRHRDKLSAGALMLSSRAESSLTVDGSKLVLSSLPWQERVFFEDKHRYKVIAKGRRVGGTTAAAHYLVDRMISGREQVLWVDTTRQNVRSYWERIFLPILSKIRREFWDWSETGKTLHLGNSTMDMRSAERPELLEGQKYSCAVLNEAGIILSDRQLWEVSIRPMLIDLQADTIFVGTPKGKLDKTGKEALYYELYLRGSRDQAEWPDWASFRIPTTENPLLDRDEIAAMAAEVPAIIRAQELEGEFVNISTESIVREEWIKYIDELPKPLEVLRKIISMDTAFKTSDAADYSAATEWWQMHDGRYLCVDAWAERLPFPALIERVKKSFDNRRVDALLIEDKASGQSLIQTLQQSNIPVIAYKPDKDKLSRLASASTKIESGQVYFLRGAWNREVIGQLIMYPMTEHDDLVDTVSQALLYMRPVMMPTANQVISRRVIRDSNALDVRRFSYVE